MDDRIYDNEFEEYLKQQTDQFRMYPGEHIWRNIHNEVHGHRNWPGLGIIGITIICALVVSTVLLKPHDIPVVQANANNITEAAKGNSSNPVSETLKQKPAEVFAKNILLPALHEVIAAKNSKEAINTVAVLPLVAKDAAPAVTLKNDIAENISNKELASLVQNATAIADTEIHTSSEKTISSGFNLYASRFNDPALSRLVNIMNISASSNSITLNESNDFRGMMLGKAQLEIGNTQVTMPDANKIATKKRPFRILNPQLLSKLDFQFYVTPSSSFRRLVDQEQGLLTNAYISGLPAQSNYVIDINKLIQHTSSIGYEVGATIGYNFNSKLALRTGFQFNVRQYNIHAYVQDPEQTSIAIVSNNSTSLFPVVSGFRSGPNTAPVVLKNRNYELSMPISIDWRPVGSGKFMIGFAAGLQPTYKFDKEPFIISANYKNYADGSALMRNWNLNANFESYVSYKAGDYRLQVGPQLRYQLKPTMSYSYPIKEFLFDYGIKVGFVKSLK